MSKLLKYEWKACARSCFPIYLAALLIALLNRVFSFFKPANMFDAPLIYYLTAAIAVMLYFGVIIAVFVVTAVILIQRFYKNLLGDEGYLMFTLPVTVTEHIGAKTLVAFAMCIIAALTAMLSFVICIGNGSGLWIELSHAIPELIAQKPLILLETLLLMSLAGVTGILFIYLCLALGHLAKKYRIAMAIVWYFVLSTGLQIVCMILLVVTGTLFVPLRSFFDWFNGLSWNMQTQIMLLGMCVACALPGTICFFGTKYILKNRLSLE